MVSIALYEQLLSADCDALRQAAEQADSHDVASVAQLRKFGSLELVSLALDLAAARRKAQIKFPDRAETIVADGEGVEQATSQCVADHKAARFDAGPIIDLCCGIGGDAMSLARHGVIAVDRDPLRAWMAKQNASCRAVVADVQSIDVAGRYVHLDPARRTAARRTHRYSDYEPGPAYIEQVVRQAEGGAIKLGPGVELDQLPAGEIEMFSERGRLVQAALWFGALRRHTRTATLLPQGASIHGEPGEPSIAPLGRYLLEPDPSLERSGLLHQLNLPAIHPRIGLLTANEAPHSPWLTAFEVIDRMPWRPRKVKDALRGLGAGIVEVKTRGKAVDPDTAQRDLRGKGDRAMTVFVLRFDQQVDAIIACR
jgi:hypothetical protein